MNVFVVHMNVGGEPEAGGTHRTGLERLRLNPRAVAGQVELVLRSDVSGLVGHHPKTVATAGCHRRGLERVGCETGCRLFVEARLLAGRTARVRPRAVPTALAQGKDRRPRTGIGTGRGCERGRDIRVDPGSAHVGDDPARRRRHPHAPFPLPPGVDGGASDSSRRDRAVGGSSSSSSMKTYYSAGPCRLVDKGSIGIYVTKRKDRC